MAIPALPIFSFRPNWQDGITESFIWVTDVLASDVGAEQRRSLRLTPGRQFETSLALWDNERAFFDLYLSRLAALEAFFPLWPNVARLREGAAMGETRLTFDTRWREFWDGTFAMVQGKDAMTFQAVEIISVDDEGLHLAAPLSRPWKVGSAVMPLRRGRWDLTDSTGFSKLSSRAATSTFRINITEPNVWPDDTDETFPIYAGYPVMTESPDVRDNLDFSFARQIATLGNDFGKSFYADLADRAFLAQAHQWYLKGRQKHAAFKDFMYRMRGRARAFWVPTFNRDMKLAAPALAAATTFEIEKMGYGYSGGPGPGREYIAIFLNDGTMIFRKVNGLLTPSHDDWEKLSLDAALGVDIAPATVRQISFMDMGRFDQDQFDFQHHTDTDGLTTVGAVFKTFTNTRTAPDPIDYPIPVTAESYTPCGMPDDFVDTCAPVYKGDMTVFHYSQPDPCNPTFGATRQLYFPETQPNAPHGKTLSAFNGLPANGTSYIYENDDYVNPLSAHYGDPAWANCRGQLLVTFVMANLDYMVTFHFAVNSGGWSLTNQYPAFFCGTVGKDHGIQRIEMCRSSLPDHPACIMSTIREDEVAGNVPYNLDFEF